MSESVKVTELKFCDIHKYELDVEGTVAHYDGKTIHGPWANMCNWHYGTHGVGLGTGKGQRLIYPEGLVEAYEASH